MSSAGHAIDPADPRASRSRRALAQAIGRLAVDPGAIPTISAITGAAKVHRATFYNHFSSVEEAAAYALSTGFEEFRLLDYGDRHRGADATSVALRTLRGILDYLRGNRELYRLASSWRSDSGLTGVTDLIVEQVRSFRAEFGGTHAGSGEAETTEDIYIASGMEGVFAAAVEETLGFDHARTAELLFSLLPEWMRQPG
jgi:AcrR family transcriptional regulator